MGSNIAVMLVAIGIAGASAIYLLSRIVMRVRNAERDRSRL
jgi:hypothetical protein